MKYILLCALVLTAAMGCQKNGIDKSIAPVPAGARVAEGGAPPKGAQPVIRPTRPSHEKPLIDTDSTTGVRGTQVVLVVVSAKEKVVAGAKVLVLRGNGGVESAGSTDDWGEYHISLAPGRYLIKVSWQGRDLSRSVQVQSNTQKIDLKFDED
jgi:hypothetical protein